MLIDPYANDSHIKKFLNSPTCHHHPYACQSKMKFEQFQTEIQYLVKVFHAIYKKFLIAIGHIDYNPSQTQSNVTRSEIYNMYGCYHTQTRILTPSEEDFLNAFMTALYKINPSLHKNLSRMKRVGIFTWILGCGVFSNARNIAKIKDDLHTLQKQNQLHQVDKHSEMLYEMDTKMLIMNNTLQQLMWTIDAI